MEVTLSGIVTEIRDLQEEKAAWPMDVRPLGRSIEERFVQNLNAYESIEVI